VTGRISLALVAVVAGVSLFPLFASGAAPDVTDPNDSRGLLDVRSANATRPPRPRFRIETYQRWTVKRVQDHGYALVYLDTIPGKRFDYYVLARSNGHRMVGTLYRDRRRKSDRRMGAVRVRRPTPKGVAMSLRMARLHWPKSRDHYRWYAQTVFTSNRCPQVCFDVAPDGAPVVEPRPGATPTPTITPTVPTPTPTPTETPTPTPTPTETPTPTPTPTPTVP
jgi:hypothetical protein